MNVIPAKAGIHFDFGFMKRHPRESGNPASFETTKIKMDSSAAADGNDIDKGITSGH